ncbi:hypothetical protein DOY81_011948 [Sarcophaga bullata]|nr:hypothetical protein DOY81_011948 [Sarcophaga bullata]
MCAKKQSPFLTAHRAPRYAAESSTNAMLWQVLYSLMGIMALGSMLPVLRPDPMTEVFKPEKRMLAVTKRSLRLAKAEVKHIRLKPIAKPDQLLPNDGAEVMAVKVGTKYEVLEGVIEGCLQSTGKFHRLYDQYNKTKTDFKVEALTKAMKFLDNNCNKLHLLLMFEETAKFEEEPPVTKKRTSPRVKNISPQRVPSQKSSNISTKRAINCKLEGDGPLTPKFSSMSRSNSPNVSHSSSHSIKQATPRSTSTTTNIGIPRGAVKRSPISGRKTK